MSNLYLKPIIICILISLGSLSPVFPQLRAGASYVHIVPAQVVGTPMSGYDRGYNTRAVGLNDSLGVRALLLDDGRFRIAIISLDLLGFNVDFDSRSGRFQQKLEGLGVDRYMIVSTHTHGAPKVLDLSNPYRSDRSWPGDKSYVGWVEERIVTAVDAAMSLLEPVTMAVGYGRVNIAFNRRLVRPDGTVEMIWGRGREIDSKLLGPTDPEVVVIRVDRSNGIPLAILFNYACHPVVLGAQNRMLTGDFPGYAARHIEKAFPDAKALFLQGAAGDIDPLIDVQNSFEPARLQGEELGREVVRISKSDVEIINSSELQWKAFEANFGRFNDSSSPLLVRYGLLVLNQDIALLALPGEPFIEHQLRFKSWSPFPHTLLVGYTNGYVGYLPTLSAYDEGGYGANYGDTMHLDPASGEKMIDTGLDEINKYVWVEPPPEEVAVGELGDFEAIVHGDFVEPGTEAIYADLSDLNGSSRTYLTKIPSGDWKLEARIFPRWPSNNVEVPLIKMMEDGSSAPLLRHRTSSIPTANLMIWMNRLDPNWELVAGNGTQWSLGHFYGDSDVCVVDIQLPEDNSLANYWSLDWLPTRPFDVKNYSSLSFEINAGLLTGIREPKMTLFVNDQVINLRNKVDWNLAEWQNIIVEFEEIKRDTRLDRIRFWGRSEGSFFIRNMGLNLRKNPTFISETQRNNHGLKRFLKVNPNPFNAETTVEYGLVEDAHVEISVYNSLGQCVTTLYRGWTSPGPHKISWKGSSASGKPLATGIYWIRMISDRDTIPYVKKVLVLN
ncbi:MAG: neutral/alkaline non-lysosomal ceramidase N-terminal domain-containing protein [Candidatus Latescibacterota bacterium]|nr:neutral/alkaline non-lysosomal ceramidase N-terminal domain-containing protein [Candidatus Latescibacterota bacterium]